jgi:hypothetical protein
MIADAGEVLNAASANKHDAVFLQVVSDARNISGDFSARVITPGAG